MSSTKWYETDPAIVGIEGVSERRDTDSTIERVIFSRWNDSAKVREMVSVHVGEVWAWADADPCGGLGLSFVEWADGKRTFARGLYYHDDESGLAQVVVGCYGSAWLTRSKAYRDAMRAKK